MTFDWRNLPDDDVERPFNPRNTVPDPQALLDGYARKSAETRNEIRGRYDLRYGKGEKETLDLHLPYGAPKGGLAPPPSRDAVRRGRCRRSTPFRPR